MEASCEYKGVARTTVAVRIAAIRAELPIANVVALGANAQLVLHIQQRIRQACRIITGHAQDVKRQALRGLLPDARKAAKFFDQALQRRGEVGHVLKHSRR